MPQEHPSSRPSPFQAALFATLLALGSGLPARAQGGPDIEVAQDDASALLKRILQTHFRLISLWSDLAKVAEKSGWPVWEDQEEATQEAAQHSQRLEAYSKLFGHLSGKVQEELQLKEMGPVLGAFQAPVSDKLKGALVAAKSAIAASTSILSRLPEGKEALDRFLSRDSNGIRLIQTLKFNKVAFLNLQIVLVNTVQYEDPSQEPEEPEAFESPGEPPWLRARAFRPPCFP